MRLPLTLALIALALALCSAPAGAETRIATSGGGAFPPCTALVPGCNLATAVATAQPGDTVLVKGGGTHTLGAPLMVGNAVELRGEDGPRPIVTLAAASTSAMLTLAAAGTSVGHLDLQVPVPIVGSVTPAPAVSASQRAVLSDLAVTSSTGCVSLSGANSEISDSTFDIGPPAFAGVTTVHTCISSTGADTTVQNIDVGRTSTFGNPAAGASPVSLGGARTALSDSTIELYPATSAVPALTLNGSGAPDMTVRRTRLEGGLSSIGDLRALVSDSVITSVGHSTIAVNAASRSTLDLLNVTAVADGADSIGIRASSAAFGNPAGVINARNSIARGDAVDVQALVPIAGCEVVGPCSAGTVAIDHSNFRTGEAVADNGGNQASNGLFEDPFGDAFNLAPGSAAVDAGAADGRLGSTDLLGNPRVVGALPDIGALEFQGPFPAAAGGDTPQPQPQVVTGGDTLAPEIASARFSPRRFAVDRAARASAPRKGSVLIIDLSELSVLDMTVQRVRPGRRNADGTCGKRRPSNKSGKKCKFTRRAGTLRRAGVTGMNSLPFSGKVGRRALKPGNYRLEIVAFDGAGNASAQRAAKFKIVR